MRRFVMWALLAAAGCKHQPVTLVPEDEITKLETDALAAATENRARKCPRPPLRGAGTIGPADTDMLAVTEPKPPLDGCEQAVLLAGDQLKPALWACTPTQKSADAFNDACEPRALDDKMAAAPEVKAVQAACAGLPEAIGHAVAHEDACSPYTPGRKLHPNVATAFYRFTDAMVALARAQAASDPAGAMRFILDVMRFGQDLARGSGLLDAMVAGTMNRRLGALAEMLVDQVPPAELDELATELDRLIASTPAFGDYLQAEFLRDVLEGALPFLEPASWTPPWGWPTGSDPRPARAKANAGGAHFASQRDEDALMLMSFNAEAAALKTACPSDASLKVCDQGLERQRAQLDEEAGKIASGKVDLRAIAAAGSPAEIRQKVITILRSGGPAHGLYTRRAALDLGTLAALRIHLEARRSGKCPDAAALAAPPYDTLRAPARLGDSLEVAITDGTYEFALPSWADMSPPASGRRTVPVAHFTCR